jgi:CubicO group peptidase (beta-lactamase class C family)
MLASVSKVFAAAAVTKLVDQGIIDLDDDICDVIPSKWAKSACRNPSFPNDKVTWRMLITHRSSLRENIPSVRNQNNRLVEASYGPSGGYADNSAAGNPTCPLDDVTGFYRDFLTNKATETSVGASMTVQGGGKINWYNVGESSGGAWQNFRPGSRSSYSNFAVGYIPALVELATGQDFAGFCKENLFEPLGMTNTAWFRDDLPTNTRVAVPVEFNGGNSFGNIGHYCYIDYASGQLHTTASDMAKWGAAMMHFGAPTLWSQSTGAELFKCQERNVQGDPPQNCEVGMGWFRLDNSMKSNAHSTLNDFKKYDWTNGGVHEGAEAGIQAHLIVLPNAGVFAAVLTNTYLNDEYAPQKMAASLARTPVPDDGPSPPAPTASPIFAPTTGPVTVVPPPTAPPTTPTMTPNALPTPTPPTTPPASIPTKAPQASPTPPPTSVVEDPQPCGDADTPIWINKRKGFKSCAWLAGRNYWKNYLCGWDTDADFYCRETCDSCSRWDDDAAYTPVGRPSSCFDLDDVEVYINDNHGWKDCSWLAGQKGVQNNQCGYNTDADYSCRSTCDSCNYWN